MTRPGVLLWLIVLLPWTVTGLPGKSFAQSSSPQTSDLPERVSLATVPESTLPRLQSLLGPLERVDRTGLQELLSSTVLLLNRARLENVQLTVRSVNEGTAEGTATVRAWLRAAEGSVFLPVPPDGCLHDFSVDGLSVAPFAVLDRFVVLPLSGPGKHDVRFTWHMVPTAADGHVQLRWSWGNAAAAWTFPEEMTPATASTVAVVKRENGWQVLVPPGEDIVLLRRAGSTPASSRPRGLVTIEETLRYGGPGSVRADARIELWRPITGRTQPFVLRVETPASWQIDQNETADNVAVLRQSKHVLELRLPVGLDRTTFTVAANFSGGNQVEVPVFRLRGPLEVEQRTDLVTGARFVPVPEQLPGGNVAVFRASGNPSVWRFVWESPPERRLAIRVEPAVAPISARIASTIRLASPITCETSLTLRAASQVSLLNLRIPPQWNLVEATLQGDGTVVPRLKLPGSPEGTWRLWLPRPLVPGTDTLIKLRLEFLGTTPERVVLPCIDVERCALENATIEVVPDPGTSVHLAADRGIDFDRQSPPRSDESSQHVRLRYSPGAQGWVVLQSKNQVPAAEVRIDVTVDQGQARVSATVDVPVVPGTPPLRLTWPNAGDVPGISDLPPGVQLRQFGNAIEITPAFGGKTESGQSGTSAARLEFVRRYSVATATRINLPTITGRLKAPAEVDVHLVTPAAVIQSVELVPVPGTQHRPTNTRRITYRYAGDRPALVVQPVATTESEPVVRSETVVYRVTADQILCEAALRVVSPGPSHVDVHVPGRLSGVRFLAARPDAKRLDTGLRFFLDAGENDLAFLVRLGRPAGILQRACLPLPEVRGPKGHRLAVRPGLIALQLPGGTFAVARTQVAGVPPLSAYGLSWRERVLFIPQLLLLRFNTGRSPVDGIADKPIRGKTLRDVLLAVDQGSIRRVLVDRYAFALNGWNPDSPVTINGESHTFEKFLERHHLAAYVGPDYLLVTVDTENYPLIGIAPPYTAALRPVLNPLLAAACGEASVRGSDASGRVATIEQWLATASDLAPFVDQALTLANTVFLSPDLALGGSLEMHFVRSDLVLRLVFLIGLVCFAAGILLARRFASPWVRALTCVAIISLLLSVHFMPVWAAALIGWGVLSWSIGALVCCAFYRKKLEPVEPWAATSTVTVRREPSGVRVGPLVALFLCLCATESGHAQALDSPLQLFVTEEHPESFLVPQDALNRLRDAARASNVTYRDARLHVEQGGSLVRVRATISLEVNSSTPVAIPLPLSTFALESIVLDGAPPQVETSNGKPAVRCSPGSHEITLEAVGRPQLLDSRAGWRTTLDWVPAAETQVELIRPHDLGLYLLTPPLCQRERVDGGRVVKGHFGPGSRIEIAWIEDATFASGPVEATCHELILARRSVLYRLLRIYFRSPARDTPSLRIGTLAPWELIASNVPVAATEEEVIVLAPLSRQDPPVVELLLRTPRAPERALIAPLPLIAGPVLHWRSLTLGRLGGSEAPTVRSSRGIAEAPSTEDTMRRWFGTATDQQSAGVDLVRSWEVVSDDFELALEPAAPRSDNLRPTVETRLTLGPDTARLEHTVRIVGGDPLTWPALRVDLPASARLVELASAPGWEALLSTSGRSVFLSPPPAAGGRSPNAAGGETALTVLKVSQTLAPKPDGRYDESDLLLRTGVSPDRYVLVVRFSSDWSVIPEAPEWTQRRAPAGGPDSVSGAIEELRLEATAPSAKIALVARPRTVLMEWEADTHLTTYQQALEGVTRFQLRGTFAAGVPLTVQLPAGTTLQYLEPGQVELQYRVVRPGDQQQGPVIEVVPQLTVTRELDFLIRWAGLPAGQALTRWGFEQPLVERTPPGLHRIHVPRSLLPPGTELVTRPPGRVDETAAEWVIEISPDPLDPTPVEVQLRLADWARPRILLIERSTSPVGRTNRYLDRWTAWVWSPFGGELRFRFTTAPDCVVTVDNMWTPVTRNKTELAFNLAPGWYIRRIELQCSNPLPPDELVNASLGTLSINAIEEESGYLWYLEDPPESVPRGTRLSPQEARRWRKARLESLSHEFAALLKSRGGSTVLPAFLQLLVGERLTEDPPGLPVLRPEVVLSRVGTSQETEEEAQALKSSVLHYLEDNTNLDTFSAMYYPEKADLIILVGTDVPSQERSAQESSGVLVNTRRLAEQWPWPTAAGVVVVLLFGFRRFLSLRLGLALLVLSATVYAVDGALRAAAALLILALVPFFIGVVLFVAYQVRAPQAEIVELDAASRNML